MLNVRQLFGRFGEDLAARHLKAEGYKILETNYRNRFGEIDIIAKDAGTIVFVEVRSRRSNRFGRAKASVDITKQKKISRIAVAYLKASRQTDAKARFDVVAIDSGDHGARIELIRNAFGLCHE